MLNTRKISMIHVGGFRPTGNPFASHFGLTPLGLPNEKWSAQSLSSGLGDQEPKNLFFICQLNLSEAPYVPEILSDIKLLTIFVNQDSKASDTNFYHIRAYKSLENLIPMNVPEGATFDKGFEVSYELAKDNPYSDDPDLIIDKQIDRASPEYEEMIDKFDNRVCSKIGGYASTIQGPVFDYYNHPANPKFCLQIDSESKVGLMWGDSGTFYLARGTAEGYEDQFFAEIQFF